MDVGGRGQSNKPKKVARRGGKVPEVAEVVEGAVLRGVDVEGGDGAEELVDGVSVEGEHFYN